MRRFGRLLVVGGLTLLAAIAAAKGQGAGKAGQAASANDQAVNALRMEELLKLWGEVSRQNDTLYAQFDRVDEETGFPSKTYFNGEALFRKPNLACVDTWLLENGVGGKGIFFDRKVAGGDAVYHMVGGVKEVNVYPLAKDQVARSIEEGPLPFLFNLRVDQAKARYEWTLMKEEIAPNGKSGSYYIKIVPRQQVDQDEFSRAWLKLDRQTFLPQALKLYDPNGKKTSTYTFNAVLRNDPKSKASAPGNYDGKGMTEQFRKNGYKVIVSSDLPGANGQPQGRPVAGGGAPAGRSQQRQGNRR